MDFVVVGFGFGALGVLLGLTLPDAGAWWGGRRRELPAPSQIARSVAWGRACRAGGRVLALGGGGICLATLLALVAGLDDRTGAAVVVTTLALATGGALGWGVAYARRYHPRPVRLGRGGRPAPRVATAEPQPVAEAIDSVLARSEPPSTDPSPIPGVVAEAPAEPLPVSDGAIADGVDDTPSVPEAEGLPAPPATPNGIEPTDERASAAVVVGEPVMVATDDPPATADEASSKAISPAEETAEETPRDAAQPGDRLLTPAGQAT